MVSEAGGGTVRARGAVGWHESGICAGVMLSAEGAMGLCSLFCLPLGVLPMLDASFVQILRVKSPCTDTSSSNPGDHVRSLSQILSKDGFHNFKISQNFRKAYLCFDI